MQNAGTSPHGDLNERARGRGSLGVSKAAGDSGLVAVVLPDRVSVRPTRTVALAVAVTMPLATGLAVALSVALTVTLALGRAVSVGVALAIPTDVVRLV